MGISVTIDNTNIGDRIISSEGVGVYKNRIATVCGFGRSTPGFGANYLEVIWEDSNSFDRVYPIGFEHLDSKKVCQTSAQNISQNAVQKICSNCRNCTSLFLPKCSKTGFGIEDLKGFCEKFEHMG